MATHCGQTNIPTTNETPLPCKEFISDKCVLHEEALAYLGLPTNTPYNELIEALVNSLSDARSRITQIESQAQLLKAKITLTPEQVKTLNSSPITLIAAQGVGTIISIHKVFMRLNYGTTPFNFPSGGVISLNQEFPTPITNILNQSQSIIKTYYPSSSTLVENTDFNITALGGDATLGDSSLEITITYEILTL